MTLLSVIKDVCAAVGVLVPQSVFSNLNANRTMQEMLALANEMAQRIAYDNRDWTRFQTTVTYPGDGTTAAFALPADYKRMAASSCRRTHRTCRFSARRYPPRARRCGGSIVLGSSIVVDRLALAFIGGASKLPASERFLIIWSARSKTVCEA